LARHREEPDRPRAGQPAQPARGGRQPGGVHMDELRNALHAAAAEPPPTRIDLDELIDGTRRRSRLQYRIGAVAGAVALSTGALLVPMVLLPSGGLSTTGGGAPPNPCPWPSFSPAPVPSGSLGVVAGPSDDPSVPAASRRPSSDPSEPAYPSGSPWFPSGSPSLPASASPWPSPSRFICYPVRPVLRCSVGSPSPSGPPPSRS